MSYPIISDYGKHTPHFFLSNFYPVEITVTIDGVLEVYESLEHAFQAHKSLNAAEREAFRRPGLYAGDAKRMGRLVENLRRDWESAKVGIMADLLAQKFKHPILREKLIDTAPAMLIEGNRWHDNFWGVCFCPRGKGTRGCHGMGSNKLGRLQMNLRESIMNGVTDGTPTLRG